MSFTTLDHWGATGPTVRLSRTALHTMGDIWETSRPHFRFKTPAPRLDRLISAHDARSMLAGLSVVCVREPQEPDAVLLVRQHHCLYSPDLTS